MLSSRQRQAFDEAGHVTVPGVFDSQLIQAALDDIEVWSAEFIAGLSEDRKRWYVESDRHVLRKLDQPVYCREVFRRMARHPPLVAMVEQLIGQGVCVCFSQVFCKPAEVGGPKPIHQDSFYFGPDDLDAMVTAWVALDEATIENGCLYYGEGSHRGPVLPHTAPPDQPFNYQVSFDDLRDVTMRPAPVARRGVSLHHGTTLHQSSANKSNMPRRAAAFHYLRRDAKLVNPILTYDSAMYVTIT